MKTIGTKKPMKTVVFFPLPWPFAPSSAEASQVFEVPPEPIEDDAERRPRSGGEVVLVKHCS